MKTPPIHTPILGALILRHAVCFLTAIAALTILAEQANSIPMPGGTSGSVVHYFGNPFDPALAEGTGTLAGPIQATVRFSQPLTEGSMLTELDVLDFEFSSDDLVWDQTSTFISMKFRIGASLVPVEWQVVLEKELLDGNSGVEQLVTTTPRLGFFREAFDEVTIGDDNIDRQFSSTIDGKGINVFNPGVWGIPEPSALLLALTAATLPLFHRTR